MIAQNGRQRTARAYLWLLVGLVGAFGLLTGYHLLFSERFRFDPLQMQALQAAPLQSGTADRRDAGPTAAGDWPQWRGPNRDGVSGETGLLTRWPAGGPKKLWEAKGGGGYSSFAVAAGKVYTILQDDDKEAVVCWQADTGKELWRFRYPAQYENDFGSGPRSTPSVDGDRVYAVGATGIFHCLKADTGAKLWRHDLLEEFKAENLQWGVAFSPLVEGDLVFTNPGGPNGNSVAAFDKKTGKLAWKALGDQAGYSSPVAATIAGVRQVVFFTASGLVGVAPKDGQALWRYPWETSFDCNIATPIVVEDYVFLSSGYGKGAAVVKVEADGGGLKARRVYETTKMCNHFSTCVLYKEHLYGFTDPGILTCMEFRTGKVRWQERGFKKGSLTLADGHLIILGEEGLLALAEATPQEYREKGRVQVFEGKCWTVPVLANGKLYLRDETTVKCLELKK
jgi:outer membrane protein assembly factor BamB